MADEAMDNDIEQKAPRMEQEIRDFLKDFPNGPLDPYRKNASFDWKEMALIIEDPQAFWIKHNVWKRMEDDPLFSRLSASADISDTEQRRLTALRTLKAKDIFPEGAESAIDMNAYKTALGQYDFSLEVKSWVTQEFFMNAIRSLGTPKHYHYIDKCYNSELIGCVALTEIGHGSNTRAMRTTATYIVANKTFEIHTPDFQAAKCWIGGLAKTATHAFVYAQLYTPDQKCHGLHTFLIPIRDPKTMRPYPGITIGDMGGKLGLSGLDNGFMMFDHHEVPKDSLLNKNSDVDDTGKYTSKRKAISKRAETGQNMSAMSSGRVGVMTQATASMMNAIVIAVRYSAVRKQFSENVGTPELPVIEYQLQQFRLFPHIAATYVIKLFSDVMFQEMIFFSIKQTHPEEGYDATMAAQELHAITCAGKPFMTWSSRDAIQECREACGGHGYLRAAGLGNLRNDNDANITYEGENNVIIQQTGNWLLRIGRLYNEGKLPQKDTPFQTLTFLQKMKVLGSEKFTGTKAESVRDPELLLSMYKWLICYLVKLAEDRFTRNLKVEPNSQQARGKAQAYFARTLSLVWIQHYMLETFWNKLIKRFDDGDFTNIPCKKVLTKLFILFGLWCIEKHIAHFLEGGYAHGPNLGNFVKDTVLQICEELKNDAVPLVDAIAPPDFVLNSVLGASDGKAYLHLESCLMQTPQSFERPSWWEDVSLKLRHKI